MSLDILERVQSIKERKIVSTLAFYCTVVNFSLAFHFGLCPEVEFVHAVSYHYPNSSLTKKSSL